MKTVISHSELKRQISYHTDKFKCDGNVFIQLFQNEKRDILIRLDYLHQIDDKEGDISCVTLTMQNEEFKDTRVFNPTQTKQIKQAIDSWVDNEEMYGRFLNY